MPDRQHPVVADLGRRIATGLLAPGTQVVPEEVASEHGVARSVVREALRVLEAKGMVQPKQRVGTRVLPPERWDALDADVIGWRVQGPDRLTVLSDLEELRAAVEPRAARLCCAHASTADAAALAELATRMRRLGSRGDLAGFTEADVAFHARLLRASGNAALVRLEGTFAALLQAREDLGTLPHQIGEHVLTLHEEVAEAVAVRDPDRAERAARELVDGARSEVLERLGEPAGALGRAGRAGRALRGWRNRHR
ncbi:MAG TPA: FCD domain-containing protein [Actinotalea caeni]|uniref:FadR/GntR family transcriptional regulator n=1 Tax=Actinotalea caeni TaxID=1348467 RepID=UPI002B4B64DA|nr:FCD domain-containing protein [Actinotalea caeni]HLV55818.1 FCD domain-containing protein [Actinotalea caeni]